MILTFPSAVFVSTHNSCNPGSGVCCWGCTGGGMNPGGGTLKLGGGMDGGMPAPGPGGR